MSPLSRDTFRLIDSFYVGKIDYYSIKRMDGLPDTVETRKAKPLNRLWGLLSTCRRTTCKMIIYYNVLMYIRKRV